MNVLVDTSVWSLSLRRANSPSHPAKLELEQLILNGRAAMIGPIRQELLSGIKTDVQFETLRTALKAFPDLAIKIQDYEEAARFFNLCRAKGVQGSNTDFLICAVAVRADMSILSTDDDFGHFAKVMPIHLHTFD